MMTDDAQLLRRYTEEGAEPAFGELVSRHIDLVFSAALRVAGGDRHLAQDVTQTVFADLAARRGVCRATWCWRAGCIGMLVSPPRKQFALSDAAKPVKRRPWK